MTDSSAGTVYSANNLVDIRALVMVRDDSTGGWVPMGGGGLSHVSIRKCDVPGESDQAKNEYLILGKRISDDSVVLSCVIKKDLEYNKVMPTFHHWKTGDKRFGLTFQTASDARAFDKGLKLAVGAAEMSRPHRNKNLAGDRGDNDETLELTVTDMDSHSASESSQRGSPQTSPQEQVGETSHDLGTRSEPESPAQSDAGSSLPLAAGHESVYPDAEGVKLVQPESSGSLKEKATETEPQRVAQPSKKIVKNRCRYCHELYVTGDNRRGTCEFAPDCVRTAVDEVACVRAARCMMYHCMSDEEGEFVQHPCDCTDEEGSHIRWMGLGFLSIFVPCLCLYPPLRGCHWCCIRCGLCGGRHRPAS